jgi:two-component system response regulator DesR
VTFGREPNGALPSIGSGEEGLAAAARLEPDVALLEALSEGDDPLTPRERDVLRAARDHPTAADVARHLYLSEGTVRNYLSSEIHKLGARNRAEDIATAEQKGWL